MRQLSSENLPGEFGARGIILHDLAQADLAGETREIVEAHAIDIARGADGVISANNV